MAMTVENSLFTLGNYTDAGGTSIGTTVAVSGNAVINSVSIGTRLGSAANNTGVVMVGGNIRFDNSALAHGGVVYGGTNSSGQYTQARTPNGGFVKGPSLDFAGISSGLLALSAKYDAATTTGSFDSKYGVGTLSGSTSPGTDVFALTTAQLGSIYSLRLAGAVGSKAIVNIDGTSFGSHFSFDPGNYAVSDIVFNFADARSISFNGINLAGSVLAPLASFTQQGGSIRGSVAVGNYSGAGGRIDGDGAFEIPHAAGAVPEPETWTMLIIGFGAVATAMRRRRQPVAA